jgi:hypothetical protein
VNIHFYWLVRAQVLSLVALIPLRKLLVRLSPGRLKKAPHILWSFCLTFNSVFHIFNPLSSEFLSKSVREESWRSVDFLHW